jgi:hypothetical protein
VVAQLDAVEPVRPLDVKLEEEAGLRDARWRWLGVRGVKGLVAHDG